MRLNPITLGALIGGVVAFVLSGAIIGVLWVVLGTAVGAAIGMGVRAFANRARTFADAVDLSESSTKAQLYERASELEIDGRSSMNRDELIAAIARDERKAS